MRAPVGAKSLITRDSINAVGVASGFRASRIKIYVHAVGNNLRSRNRRPRAGTRRIRFPDRSAHRK